MFFNTRSNIISSSCYLSCTHSQQSELTLQFLTMMVIRTYLGGLRHFDSVSVRNTVSGFQKSYPLTYCIVYAFLRGPYLLFAGAYLVFYTIPFFLIVNHFVCYVRFCDSEIFQSEYFCQNVCKNPYELCFDIKERLKFIYVKIIFNEVSIFVLFFSMMCMVKYFCPYVMFSLNSRKSE